MDPYLTVSERLKDLRKEHNLTIQELEEKTGVSHSALGRYESGNQTDLSPYNLIKLADFYDVTMDYLMGLTDQRKPSNDSIGSLRISEEAIEVLRSKKINNHVLSKLITHEGFKLLLIDIEIYIRCILTAEIDKQNLLMDFGRIKIMDEHKIIDEDTTLRSISVGKLEEENFVKDTIFKDLSIIIDSLRGNDENNKKIEENIKQTRAMYTALNNLMLKAYYDGQHISYDILIKIMCDSLGIPTSKLSNDELKTITDVLKKSELLKIFSSLRGKT